MREELHRQILELYREADAEVAAAGPVCQASGRCCRFAEYGHTLFLSSLEAEVLLGRAPAHEQPADERFCPFQVEGLCTAREPRPLGCRVYFCDPTYQERMAEITEKYLRRLKELADREGEPWSYAPLHRFLNAGSLPTPPPNPLPGAERGSKTKDSPSTPGPTVLLPLSVSGRGLGGGVAPDR